MKQLREEAGLLHKNVYDQLDTNKSTFIDCEKGKVAIAIDTFYKASEATCSLIQKSQSIKNANIQNNSDFRDIIVSQNHNGNLTIHISKKILDSLKKKTVN